MGLGTRRDCAYRRRGWLAASGLVALAAIGTGCGGSGDTTSSPQSTTTAAADQVALLSNGDFEEGLASWATDAPDGVDFSVDRGETASGQRAVKLTAADVDINDSVVLTQATNLLPESKAGSQYMMTMEVRTDGLNRPIPVNLKLVYKNGDYEFFSGGTAGVRTGIPDGTNADWTEVQVPAFAKRPLDSVEVFPINSGPGRLDGTVWIDDVKLEAVG